MSRRIYVKMFAFAGMLAVEFVTGYANARAEWTDTPITRIETLALLESFNAELLSNDSATATLERWCSTHQLAQPAKVIAERVHGEDKAPSEEVRQLLRVSATEQVKYRHVRLHCGEHVLSEADNWYVPARLTSGMNQVLDTTDTPFGRAVQELHFQRRTLSAHLLWSPLPNGWEMQSALQRQRGKEALSIPHELIQHQAVLSVPEGTPFSVVVETYTSEILAFAQPPSP